MSHTFQLRTVRKRPFASLAFVAVLTISTSALRALAIDHVIHVSVDGLNSDMLRARMDSFPTLYPNFIRLMNEGASTLSARTDFTITKTLPNHISMITGRPVSQPSGFPDTTHHGYTNNEEPNDGGTLHEYGNLHVDYIASVFDVAHDNGLSTALYASKDKFVFFDRSYNESSGALDTTGVDNGRDKIDFYVEKSTGSPENASNMQADFLSDMATHKFNYSFVCYRDPDSAGHASGWASALSDTAVQNVDRYLGELLDLVESDAGLLDSTAIIVTSDHGSVGSNHDDPALEANFKVPFLVWGTGIAAGADLYSLNPTTRRDPGPGRTLEELYDFGSPYFGLPDPGRPDYDAAIQPIRNGDSGNLALDLLGLPPIPGSLINYNQDLRVTVPEPGTVVLMALAIVGLFTIRKR